MRSNLKISVHEEFPEFRSQSSDALNFSHVLNNDLVYFNHHPKNLSFICEHITNQNIKSHRSIIALSLLLLFQILDGVFTYSGISVYGNEIEGNPLITYLMSAIGSFWGISAAKIFSIFSILLLWNLRHKVRWIPKSIEYLSVYYLFFAIIPWGLVLSGII